MKVIPKQWFSALQLFQEGTDGTSINTNHLAYTWRKKIKEEENIKEGGNEKEGSKSREKHYSN